MAVVNQGFEFSTQPEMGGNLAAGGFEYAVYAAYFPKMTAPPAIPTIVSPVTGRRVAQATPFIISTTPDVGGLPLHFKIDISLDNGFSTLAYTFDTSVSVAGWQYSLDNTTWTDFPTGGLTFTGTAQIRYTPVTTLAVNRYYWRAIATNGGWFSPSYATTTSVTVGDKLIIQLKVPVLTSVAAKMITATLLNTIPTDGTPPQRAKLIVKACNNGYDVNPTWEDITSAVQAGQSYTFTNVSKTASSWGINLNIEIDANASVGALSQNGFGFSFN
jgi:hypothetical protein